MCATKLRARQSSSRALPPCCLLQSSRRVAPADLTFTAGWVPSRLTVLSWLTPWQVLRCRAICAFTVYFVRERRSFRGWPASLCCSPLPVISILCRKVRTASLPTSISYIWQRDYRGFSGTTGGQPSQNARMNPLHLSRSGERRDAKVREEAGN